MQKVDNNDQHNKIPTAGDIMSDEKIMEID